MVPCSQPCGCERASSIASNRCSSWSRRSGVLRELAITRPRRFREGTGVVTALDENRERIAEDISGSRGSAIRYVARKAEVGRLWRTAAQVALSVKAIVSPLLPCPRAQTRLDPPQNQRCVISRVARVLSYFFNPGPVRQDARQPDIQGMDLGCAQTRTRLILSFPGYVQWHSCI